MVRFYRPGSVGGKFGHGRIDSEEVFRVFRSEP